MFKKLFVFILFLLLSNSFGQLLNTDSVKVMEAKVIVENWLKLVDNGKYAESWDEASTFLKGKVTKEEWILTISNLKPSFGKTNTREIQSAQYSTELPGAPDGEYVVFQYKTNFKLKNNSIETIVPMIDSDGKWRVSGYFVK